MSEQMNDPDWPTRIALCTNKAEATEIYAEAIRSDARNEGQPVVWRTLNAAIIERWSESALRDVKRDAWKAVA